MLDDWTAGWTDRLGLTFTDDCQESQGLLALWFFAASWFGGKRGQQRSANCESKEGYCPAGYTVTGLQVKTGSMRRGGNREMYDFRLRCGSRWQPRWLGLRFDVGTPDAVAAGVCPDGEELTGVQVMRGRQEGRDYYAFKLRCARVWREVVGLPFDALRETRSATCPHARAVTGVRVHRGFQDWGSVDTYEFQLRCDEDDDASGGGADEASTTQRLADLLVMGGEEMWQMVASLMPEPDPTVDTEAPVAKNPHEPPTRASRLLRLADEL